VCDTNIEDLGMGRGHRVLPILGKGYKPALILVVPRTAVSVPATPSIPASRATVAAEDAPNATSRAS
jgi:hypothetical protein